MASDYEVPLQIGSGGLNLRDSALEVGPNGLVDSINWRLDERGALIKRLGSVQNGLGPFGSGILEMAAFNPSTSSGSANLVAVCANGNYRKATAGNSTTIGTGFSTSAVPSFAQMLDKIYWSNGVNAVQQWDGTTLTAISGINDVQTITTTGTPTGGTFALTYPPTGATTTALNFNATAAQVQAALLAILGAGTVACTGGPLPTGIVCTFQGSLGFTALQVLTHSDNLTGGSSPAVVVTHTTTGRGDAPKGKYLAVWRNRLWVASTSANPNRVYWSGSGDPTVWTSTNFVDILDPRGDQITSIHSSPNIGTDADGADGVLVYKRRSTHRIIDDSDNVSGVQSGGANVMIDSATGTVNNRTVRTLNSRVYSLGVDGIYSTDGHSSLTLESDQLGPLVSDFTAVSSISQASAAAYKNVYMLTLPPVGTSVPLVLEVYTSLGRVGARPIMASQIPIWASAIYVDAAIGDEFVFAKAVGSAPDGAGTVYTAFMGGTDAVFASAAIRASATTGASTLGTDAQKRIRRIRAVGRGQTIVGVLADFATGQGDVQQFLVDVSDTPPLWNEVNWNQFNWSGAGDSGVSPVSRYFGTRGRWFAFTVTETSTSVSQSSGALGIAPSQEGGAVVNQLLCTVTPLAEEV